MSLIVTMHVFSGRPDPQWVVPDEGEAEWNVLLARASAAAQTTNLKPTAVVAGLGYRGFTVRNANNERPFYIHGGIVDPGARSPSLLMNDRILERWLLATGGRHVNEQVASYAAENIAQAVNPNVILVSKYPSLCPPCVAVDAPAYDQKAWGGATDGNDTVDHNNCYNYANNRITDSMALPGRASGHLYTQTDSVSGAGSVLEAATFDGLVVCDNFTTALAAGAGWYVALALWPGQDFHFYRQDHGGCWSHKLHDNPVRSTDNSNYVIRDPKSADRGPYSVFVSYMITKCCISIK